MIWLKLINFFRKRRGGKGTSSKKWIILLLVLVVLILGAVFMLKSCSNDSDLLEQAKRAIAGTEALEDWQSEPFKRQTNSTADFSAVTVSETYEENSGGLSGLGYDFGSYVASTDESDVRHVQAQTLELLDFLGVEWTQPTTLFGLSLLSMETGFWDKTLKAFKDTQYDIYKYSTTICRSPGIGGGRVEHNDGTYNAGAFGLVQFEGKWVDNNKKGKDDLAEVNPKSSEIYALSDCKKDVVDIISRIFGSEDNYYQVFNANSAVNGVTYNSYDDYYKDVSNMTQNIFAISVQLATQSGGLPNSLTRNGHDSNLWETGAHVALTFNLLNFQDIQFKTLSNLGEAGANVLATMMGLWAWNGGAGYVTGYNSTENEQLRHLLLYDLAKYLADNGASDIYAAGWHHLGNATKGSLSTDSAKKLEEDFYILLDKLYPSTNQAATRQKMETMLLAYCNTSAGKEHSGFVYAIMGILRAQYVLNDAAQAGIIASDGTTPNVYSALYRRTFNTTASGVSGVIAKALQAGELALERNMTLCGSYVSTADDSNRGKVTTSIAEYAKKVEDEFRKNLPADQHHIQYSQDFRWSGKGHSALAEGAFFDCSSFVSYLLSQGGLTWFDSHSITSDGFEGNGVPLINGLINDGSIQTIFLTSDTGEYAAGGLDKSQIEQMCEPGDIIVYNYTTSKTNGRPRGVDHVALYYGNGRLLESCPGRMSSSGEYIYLQYQGSSKSVVVVSDSNSGSIMRGPGIYIRSIYSANTIVGIFRLTDAALPALGFNGATAVTGAVPAGSGTSAPYSPNYSSSSTAGSGNTASSGVNANPTNYKAGQGLSGPHNSLPAYNKANYIQRIEIPFNHNWRFAEYSIIHSDSGYLYYPANYWNGYVICVNAGHGTDTKGEQYACKDGMHGNSIRFTDPEKKPDSASGYGTANKYGYDGTYLYTLPNSRGVSKMGATGTNKGYFSYAISDGASLAQRTTIYTDKLNGKTYTVETSHEWGANFINGLVLRDKLLGAGFAVLMIRDEGCLSDNSEPLSFNDIKITTNSVSKSKVQLDNVARTVMANNVADAHISLHYDSTDTAEGAFFINIPTGTNGKAQDKYTAIAIDENLEYFNKDNTFGEILLDHVKNKGYSCKNAGGSPQYSGSPNDLTQTCFSTIPSVDIELGGKTCKRDIDSINKFCDGIVTGLTYYFNVN